MFDTVDDQIDMINEDVWIGDIDSEYKYMICARSHNGTIALSSIRTPPYFVFEPYPSESGLDRVVRFDAMSDARKFISAPLVIRAARELGVREIEIYKAKIGPYSYVTGRVLSQF